GWREEVTVETWPSGADLLYATRDFNVRTGAGTLARGTSAWLLVDANRRRPIRVPDFIKRIELPERERVLEDRTDKLPDPPDSAEEHPVRVRYSDQDLIGHVNNVLYIDWAVESVPLVETHVVQSLEAQFRAEAHYGDLVTVRTRQAKRPGEFLHLVKSEDLELARIRTTWRPRGAHPPTPPPAASRGGFPCGWPSGWRPAIHSRPRSKKAIRLVTCSAIRPPSMGSSPISGMPTSCAISPSTSL